MLNSIHHSSPSFPIKNIKELTVLFLFALLTSSAAYCQDGPLTAELDPNIESERPAASKERSTAVAPMTTPQFPGGMQGIQDYLMENVEYPAIAEEYGVEGKVIVMATVSESGQIIDASVIKGMMTSCDQEALSAVQQMPLWTPGTRNGVAIPTKVMFEVKFSLQ